MALSRGLLSTVVVPTMRGRVLSVDMMAHGFVPLGVIPVSFVAESAGMRRLDRWLRVARQRG